MNDIENINEDEAPTNTTSGIATKQAPMFMVTRQGKHKEYVVTDSVYQKLKYGKKPYERWNKFIGEDVDLKTGLQKDLNKESKIILTNQLGATSVFLRKSKLKNNFRNDDMMLSFESTSLHNEESEIQLETMIIEASAEFKKI